MNFEEYLRIQSRRSFLHHCVGGLGTAALAHLLTTEGRAASSGAVAINPLAPKPPHFTPKAKNVIFLLDDGYISYLTTSETRGCEISALRPSICEKIPKDDVFTSSSRLRLALRLESQSA